MAYHRKKIDTKMKLLQYATKDIDQAMDSNNEIELKDKIAIIEKSLGEINKMKYTVIETTITNEVEGDELDNWTHGLEKNITPFDTLSNKLKTAWLT